MYTGNSLIDAAIDAVMFAIGFPLICIVLGAIIIAAMYYWDQFSKRHNHYSSNPRHYGKRRH